MPSFVFSIVGLYVWQCSTQAWCTQRSVCADISSNNHVFTEIFCQNKQEKGSSGWSSVLVWTWPKWVSETHALGFLGESLRPHEAFSETRLESFLLVLWKVPLFHHLVQRLHLWSLFPQQQPLSGKRRDSWLVELHTNREILLNCWNMLTFMKAGV